LAENKPRTQLEDGVVLCLPVRDIRALPRRDVSMKISSIPGYSPECLECPLALICLTLFHESIIPINQCRRCGLLNRSIGTKWTWIYLPFDCPCAISHIDHACITEAQCGMSAYHDEAKEFLRVRALRAQREAKSGSEH